MVLSYVYSVLCFLFLWLNSNQFGLFSLTIFAGVPAKTTFSSVNDLFTVALAPIVLLLPMVMLPKRIAPGPI